MFIYLYLSLILYFGTITLFPIFLWRNYLNLSYILNVPNFVITYVIASQISFNFAATKYSISDETVRFYTNILTISSVLTAAGIYCGFHKKNIISACTSKIILAVTPSEYFFRSKKVITISIISIFLFTISYIGMGFVPMFAESPLEAKFFSGVYRERYQQFAIPFRLAVLLAQSSILFLFVRIYNSKRNKDIILLILTLVPVIFSLRRAYIGGATVVFFLALSFYRKKFQRTTLILYFLVFSFGASFTSLVLYLSGSIDKFDLNSVFEGVPDLADQLLFIDSWFAGHWQFTYGKSIVGGLIPYNYEFNPANLSKLVTSNSNDVASGGYRLPVPILGYIAFGWYGVVIFPFLHGFIQGSILRTSIFLYTNAKSFEDYILKYVLVGLFYTLGNNYISLNIDLVINIIIIYWIFISSRYKLVYG